MRFTIIGAGIAGLTTAIALTKKGFEVEIFESADRFTGIGSGITLAPNAMQILKRLDLYDDVIKHGTYLNSFNIRTKNLALLTTINLFSFEKDFKVKSVSIHRSELQKILLSHLGNIKIHFGKKLKSIEQEPAHIELLFEDGTNHTATYLIGADGIHSKVRKSIFPKAKLRDAEQICWRGISNITAPTKLNSELNEIWGKGKRFGFVQLTNDTTYWFALMSKKQYLKENKEIDLLDLFNSFDETILSLIKNTPNDKILTNEIWDLAPLHFWYDKNVCLVGDSCHATTPNMGQGAVQAIESAEALSICIKSNSDNIQLAFKKYQLLRSKKANKIIKMSWILGKMAQSNIGLICLARDILSRYTPSFLTQYQAKSTYKLNF